MCVCSTRDILSASWSTYTGKEKQGKSREKENRAFPAIRCPGPKKKKKKVELMQKEKKHKEQRGPTAIRCPGPKKKKKRTKNDLLQFAAQGASTTTAESAWPAFGTSANSPEKKIKNKKKLSTTTQE